MSTAILLDNVSKKFIIHHEKKRSFQEMFVSRFRDNGGSEEFWALQNVSFAVRKGETVGIVGQNGSGKSTVLKLISRIIEPTSGKVTVNGAMSSLLELGAGFHPDLTGRDNVFLNGSMLGFSRREMERKFDEVVAFSELEQFIDVPVKHYSSGMYMRLAFAVAINVNPDILLIDEVLAVGDKAFQDKCFERIRDFQRAGKTILFVSHSLEIVKNICNRAIWLDQGRIRSIGDTKRVVLDYLNEVESLQEFIETQMHPQFSEQVCLNQTDDSLETAGIQIRSVKLLGRDRLQKHAFRHGDDAIVRIYYALAEQEASQEYTFSVSTLDASGTLIHRALCSRKVGSLESEPSRGILELKYLGLPLLEGTYALSAGAWRTDSSEPTPTVYHQQIRFHVIGDTSPGNALEDGLVSMRHEWISTECPPSVPIGRAVAAEFGDFVDLVSNNERGEALPASLPAHIYAGENDAGCLVSGWFGAEGDIPKFRWTNRQAALLLHVPEHSSNLILKASDPNAGLRQIHGRVLANGVLIGEFEMQDASTRALSFCLNGDCRGEVGITIEVEPTLVPAQIGLNEDTRELGLLVYEIWSE